MSKYSKQHLSSLLGLFEDACSHLRSSIGDFKMQIRTKTMECLDNTSGNNMTVKDAIVMVTTAQNTVLEHVDMLTDSNKMYSPEESEKESDHGYENISELSCRLEHIETTLSALEVAKQKTEDDITDIKKWKENCEIEQHNGVMKIEQLSKKQKQNFKNLRKQLSENDNKVEKLNKTCLALNEELLKSNKTIEMVSLDIKAYENNLRKINNDLNVYKEETDSLTQEIKNHSDKISVLQEEQMKSTMSTTHTMVKIENLRKDVIKQLQDSHTTVNQPMKHSTVGFIALEGRVKNTFGGIQYEFVVKNIGNSFDSSTGMFTALVDGLYIVSLTIDQTGDETIAAGVVHTSDGKRFFPGTVVNTKKSENATGTFVIWMKHGDELYSWTDFNNCKVTNFICFLLNI